MSWQPSNDPVLGDPKTCDALDLIIVPRTRDLGDGFAVRRALPHGKRQMVGPFIFFDHFGPDAVHRRQGHGRAPASAYRACHRHLSVRRLDHASRQRGQHPGDPARRDEPDDGGARHRAFRAHARRAAPRRPEDAGPAKLDRAAGGLGRDRAVVPALRRRGAADGDGERLHRAHHRRQFVRREIAGQHGVAVVLYAK